MDRFSFMDNLEHVIMPAFGITFRILIATTVLSVFIGFLLAIILVISNKDGLHENKYIYKTLDFIINIIRSFPFIILLISLVPVTRFITGSSIGEKAAIFPLTVSMAPFVARLISNHLEEVDKQLIEAAQSFGLSTRQIIWHVMIVESIPSISSVICFTVIAGLGATTAAGMVGAGGLGNVAIRYGFQNFNYKIMYSVVLILVVIVQIIQHCGNVIYNKLR